MEVVRAFSLWCDVVPLLSHGDRYLQILCFSIGILREIKAMGWAQLKMALPSGQIQTDDGIGIIPIWPCFADMIYAKSKSFEYRKVRPRANINIFVVYETMPISMITGFFRVKRTISASPHRIWKDTNHEAGITEELFFRYFSGREIAYAIHCHSATRFEKPLRLDVFNCKPPQAYVYP